jgi:hypothetical protein
MSKDEKKLTEKDIRKSVDDWEQRINDLYTFIENSFNGYIEIECKKDKCMTMYEELMQKFGIEKREIPMLEVYKNRNLIIKFKPIGLWVIGANGRIDILTHLGSYILADISVKKAKKSDWIVYSPDNRQKGEKFTKEFILELVDKI